MSVAGVRYIFNSPTWDPILNLYEMHSPRQFPYTSSFEKRILTSTNTVERHKLTRDPKLPI